MFVSCPGVQNLKLRTRTSLDNPVFKRRSLTTPPHQFYHLSMWSHQVNHIEFLASMLSSPSSRHRPLMLASIKMLWVRKYEGVWSFRRRTLGLFQLRKKMWLGCRRITKRLEAKAVLNLTLYLFPSFFRNFVYDDPSAILNKIWSPFHY